MEKVASALSNVVAALCYTLYNLREYLSSRRTVKAFRSVFASESPWMSSMQSAVATLETLVQVMAPEQAIKLFGPGVLLPIVKFMCSHGHKTSNSRSKGKKDSPLAHSPEYDAHMKKVLTTFIRLTAILVHRWGPPVVDILRSSGGIGAAGVVIDLWLDHYKKMDLDSQKVTLLALGKMLEARIRVVSSRVGRIGQCFTTPLFKQKDLTAKIDPLDIELIRIRKARNLMDPTVLEAKQVRHYVSRCCELTIRSSPGQSFHLEVPKMTRSKKSGTRSANNSPVRKQRPTSSRVSRVNKPRNSVLGTSRRSKTP
mmetsp:Transcript_10013/g.24663  ORF Transcript_10013/g.24663 Transcript_10013/m.24663 type:complete len:312 (+) Transcript_10013:1-936(+)